MGLQRVGDRDMTALLDKVEGWLGGTPLERRAAGAGPCEPRLLRDPAAASRTIALVRAATDTLLAEPDRRGRGRPDAAQGPGVRVERRCRGPAGGKGCPRSAGFRRSTTRTPGGSCSGI